MVKLPPRVKYMSRKSRRFLTTSSKQIKWMKAKSSLSQNGTQKSEYLRPPIFKRMISMLERKKVHRVTLSAF
jgi:hypothetical protein